MKIAKHWVRESAIAEDNTGYKYHLISWSGSNSNLAEARQKALAKLERWKVTLQRGELLGFYPLYDKGEIREELVEEIFDEHDNLIAAITRNRYGALVLNSARLLFADVDLPHTTNHRPGLLSKILSFWGTKDELAEPVSDVRNEYRQRFAAFYAEHPELALRIYETYAGFRIVVLNRLFDPLSKDAQMVLEEMNSDALYMRLCRSQECFRARLTPKPWRCRLSGPPYQCRFPRETKASQQRFAAWLENYTRRTAGYGVCNLVEEFGTANLTDEAQAILQIHDQYVLNGERPLA